MYTIDQLIDLVNKAISEPRFNREPDTLYAPIRYILSLGGKRIRPVLMLMGYNIYENDVERILNNAIALEVYHNFTLLHDDLMDRSELRRGNATVHMKWDDNTAILSGDTMLIMAYELFQSGVRNNEALDEFIKATLGVCEGQQYDMDFEKRLDVKESEYMEMIRMKTSLLLGYALKIGAMLGRASKEDAELLYDFGEKMGLAFQLQDDLLDVYGDPAVFRKKLGGDIVENKKTFLLIKALELASETQLDTLKHWLSINDNNEAKIEAVTNIYNEIGIKSLTEKKIEEIFAASLESLDKVGMSDDKKQPLRDFANRLMGRKY